MVEERELRERKKQNRTEVIERDETGADRPLERKASGEILDELIVMEMEIRRAYEAHLRSQSRARPQAVRSPAKNRILRALRDLDD